MKLLSCALFLGVCLAAGCASTGPNALQQFQAGAQPVDKRLPISSTVRFYSAPDSSQHAVRQPAYVVADASIYVVSQTGRWYRGQNPGRPAYYFLASDYRAQKLAASGEGSGTGGASRSLQTGPRGGVYYINSNGNKTYTGHK